MKIRFSHYCLLMFCFATFASCDYFGGGGRKFETSDGIAKLVSDLKNEFGKEAFYTSIGFAWNSHTGTSINATGTADPASKKMMERTRLKGVWKNNSEITLEISGDAKPTDFMFTLADLGDLSKVPDMIKQSVEKIRKEKNFDVVATNVTIHSPDELKEQTERFSYHIILEAENGGTSFTTIFDQNGNFKRLIY